MDKEQKEHVCKLLNEQALYEKEVQALARQQSMYCEKMQQLANERHFLSNKLHELQKRDTKSTEVKNAEAKTITAFNVFDKLETHIYGLQETRRVSLRTEEIAMLQEQAKNFWNDFWPTVREPSRALVYQARYPLLPYFDKLLANLKIGDKFWRFEARGDQNFVFSDVVHHIGLAPTTSTSSNIQPTVTLAYIRNGIANSVSWGSNYQLGYERDGNLLEDVWVWPQLPADVMPIHVQQQVMTAMLKSRLVFVDL